MQSEIPCSCEHELVGCELQHTQGFRAGETRRVDRGRERLLLSGLPGAAGTRLVTTVAEAHVRGMPRPPSVDTWHGASSALVMHAGVQPLTSHGKKHAAAKWQLNACI